MIDKKTQILTTAIDLFVEKGFDRVSTAEISKTAEVATGTMFYHFNTKEDIIISSYKLIKTQFILQTLEGNSLNNPIYDVLKTKWKNMILWAMNHKKEVQYLLQFKNSPYYCDNLMAEDDTWKELVHWWERGIQEKVFKQLPLDYLLKTFNDLLFGTIEYLFQNEDKVDEYITVSFNLCWDCISLKHT
ncbi:TetR/AcrR family transcriptional regulator [Lutibacter sp. B1]|uniref:TetR/AcrR family transcriptional regulator n=1 Tax=Lutibacter sp. B1 TaxID=2725996 RepID=UPI0014569F7E|nr:TetR/AcrR family transcriptional regulator [Lutibacter sp. B1]NLP58325.1 TetR/AcrR family transcriptional regulator [Lutibacter sp. B1]